MTIKGILNSCLYEDKNYDYVANQLAELCNKGKTDGKHIKEIYFSWMKTHQDEIYTKIQKNELDQWFINDLESQLKDKVFNLANGKELKITINDINKWGGYPTSYEHAKQFITAQTLKVEIEGKTYSAYNISGTIKKQVDNGTAQRITQFEAAIFSVERICRLIEISWNNMGGISQICWKVKQQ